MATATLIRHVHRKGIPLKSRALAFIQFDRSFASDNTSSYANESTEESASSKRGFLSLLFGGKTGKRELPHSKLLTDSKRIYELQFHIVKPEYKSEYIKLCETALPAINENEHIPGKLLGSWTTQIGQQDQAVHMFMHENGYETYEKTSSFYRNDPALSKALKAVDKMLYKRYNHLCQEFGFWGDVKPRSGSNIYELRTYHLKPGTLLEWAQHWAKGINYRKAYDEPVCGLFIQIGELYTVHHIWSYKDLQTRSQARENAWSQPGWDECVMHTVPLIRHMDSDILLPMSCSSLQ